MIRNRARAFEVAAGTLLAIGLGIVVAGIWLDETARAAGGSSLAIFALVMISLSAVRRWIRTASDERGRQLDAVQEAAAAKARYVAAMAALEVERNRLRRDAEAEIARSAAVLASERQKLRAEFDAERDKLVRATFAQAVEMWPALMDSAQERSSTVIRFPRQPLDEDSAPTRGVSHPS